MWRDSWNLRLKIRICQYEKANATDDISKKGLLLPDARFKLIFAVGINTDSQKKDSK